MPLKHTRGPWRALTEYYEPQIIGPDNDLIAQIIRTEWCVKDKEEIKANADLLAAAPDLLAAAIGLLENALDRNECHDEEDGEMYEDWLALKRAIDKAQGREC